MSKSKGNVVSPDEMVAKYGADSVRSYVLFMGPAESDAEWNDQGIEGVYRFLGRVWRTVTDALEEGSLSGSAQLSDAGAQPGAAKPAAGSDAARSGADARRFDAATLTATERSLLVKTNQVVAKVIQDVGERFRFDTVLAAIRDEASPEGQTKNDQAHRALVRPPVRRASRKVSQVL